MIEQIENANLKNIKNFLSSTGRICQLFLSEMIEQIGNANLKNIKKIL